MCLSRKQLQCEAGIYLIKFTMNKFQGLISEFSDSVYNTVVCKMITVNYFLSLTEYFFRSCWRRSNGDFAISTEEYSCFAGMIHKYICCNEYKHMMKNPVCNIYLLIESGLTVNDDFICFLQKQFSIYLTLDQYMKPDVRRNTLVTFMKEFFKKVRSRSVSWFCVGKNKKTMF